jgi:hypothetical protein
MARHGQESGYFAPTRRLEALGDCGRAKNVVLEIVTLPEHAIACFQMNFHEVGYSALLVIGEHNARERNFALICGIRFASVIFGLRAPTRLLARPDARSARICSVMSSRS